MPDAWERWQATGLIDRWAAVEPARCDATGLVHVDGHWSGAGLPGSVLAATIEAITARGWMWSLGTVTSKPSIWGFVNPDGARSHKGAADTPAEALLTAYLAALEAEAA